MANATARDVLVNAGGGLICLIVGGLVAWAWGLNASVGDLDTRTRAIDLSFTNVQNVLDQNARQIGQNATEIGRISHQIELMSSNIAQLVSESQRAIQANRQDINDIRTILLSAFIGGNQPSKKQLQFSPNDSDQPAFKWPQYSPYGEGSAPDQGWRRPNSVSPFGYPAQPNLLNPPPTSSSPLSPKGP